MSQQSPSSVALGFLKEWEEGRQPHLTDYLVSRPADADEIRELVADAVVFEALARPLSDSACRTRP